MTFSAEDELLAAATKSRHHMSEKDARDLLDQVRSEVAARTLREAGAWLGDEGAIGIEDLLKWRADAIEKGEADV